MGDMVDFTLGDRISEWELAAVTPFLNVKVIETNENSYTEIFRN